MGFIQKPYETQVLPELVKESTSVQARLRQRINESFTHGREQMEQIVDKMEGLPARGLEARCFVYWRRVSC